MHEYQQQLSDTAHQPSYQQHPHQQPNQQSYQQPYQSPYRNQEYYGAAPGYRQTVPNIPNYLGWAIASLILTFWPTGIVAVVYASRVNNKLLMGDIAGAQHASTKAKMWAWISLGIALAGWVIAILIIVIAALSGVATYNTF